MSDVVDKNVQTSGIDREAAELAVWLANKQNAAAAENAVIPDPSDHDASAMPPAGTPVDNDNQDEAGFDSNAEEIVDVDDENKNQAPANLPSSLTSAIIEGINLLKNVLLGVAEAIGVQANSENNALENIGTRLSSDVLKGFFDSALNSLANSAIEGEVQSEVLEQLESDINALTNIITSFQNLTTLFVALQRNINEAKFILKDYEGVAWWKFIPEETYDDFKSYSNMLKATITFQDNMEKQLLEEYEFDNLAPGNFASTEASDLDSEIKDQNKIIEFLEATLGLISKTPPVVNPTADLDEDPALDTAVELVYDEGEGSSQDGVEEAADAENEELEAITENETYEEYPVEEVIIDDAEPPMTAQDYLDLLESRGAGLTDGEFFGNLPDAEDDPELVANFMLPASSLPGFDTMLTPSLISVDLPEPIPSFEDSKFVYNYYVADEENRTYIDQNSRKRMAEEFKTADDIEAVLADEGKGRYYLPPRYNIVKFSSTVDIVNQAIDTSGEYSARSILSSNPDFKAVVEDIKRGNKLGEKLILTEGGLSTSKFSSSELINTDINSMAVKKMFSVLSIDAEVGKNNSIINGNSETFKDTSLENFMNKYFDRNNIENTDQKKLVSNYLKSLSQESDSFSPNQTELSTNSDIIRFASFPLTFDNASFYDVILSADLEFGGMLENELDSYKDYAFSFYTKASLGFSDGISANDYQSIIPQKAVLDVEAYDPDIFTSNGNGLPETSSGLRPHIEHSGYIVEKIEIDGQTGNSQQKKPIFVAANATSFVDLDVLYGYDYVYKVRTLAILEYDFVIPNTDAEDSQLARGAFLITSKYNPIRIRCQENKPPSHPISLSFKYEPGMVTGDGVSISWLYPHNPQRDIVGFEIYKRDSLSDPFALLAVYNFKDPVGDINLESYKQLDLGSKFVFNNPVTDYFDKDFNTKKQSIYAVVSIDAHGMKSGYSPQYLVDFDGYTNQINVKTISMGGSPLGYPNYFVNEDMIKTFNEVAKTSNKNRVTICFNPKYYDLNEKNPDGSSNSINLISKSKEIDKNYIMNITNIDIVKSSNIDISIDDRSIQSNSIFTNGNLQEENLSFSLTNNE